MKYSPHPILFLTVLMLFLAGCAKDKTIQPQNPLAPCVLTDSLMIPVKDTLLTLPFCNSPFGWQWVYTRRYQYFAPCFNPNNQNELVYGRQDRQGDIYSTEIRILDLCTGKDRLISNNGYVSPWTQWSKTDWILFTGNDGNLWKVKSSGTDLIKISAGSNFNNDAVWNYDGSKILFRQQANHNDYILVTNQDGIIEDTIEKLVASGYWSWGMPDKLAIVTPNPFPGDGIGYYDFTRNTIVQIKAIPQDPNNNSLLKRSVKWFNQYKALLWSSIGMVSVTDTLTAASVTLRAGSDYFEYGNTSVSANDKKIAIERLDKTIKDTIGINWFLNYENNIYLMNSDGSDWRRIKFPE